MDCTGADAFVLRTRTETKVPPPNEHVNLAVLLQECGSKFSDINFGVLVSGFLSK